MERNKCLVVTITMLIVLSFYQNSVFAQRKVVAYNQKTVPAPQGMTYVPGGSILLKYGSNEADSTNLKKIQP